MLATDCLLGVVASAEKLTDIAVDNVAVTPDAAAGMLAYNAVANTGAMHDCSDDVLTINHSYLASVPM